MRSVPQTDAGEGWPLVVVHIPKAAGTSLVEAFRTALPASALHLDYESYSELTTPRVRELVYGGAGPMTDPGELEAFHRAEHAPGPGADRPVEPSAGGRRRLLGELATGPTALLGHFPASAYWDGRGPARFAALVRDPVERMLSQFAYVKQQGWVDGPLEEYVENPRFQNVQTKFLGSPGIDALDFVGLVERFPESLDRLGRLAGLDLRMHRENVSARESVDASPAIRREIARRNRDDLELYERARERFDEADVD